MMNLRKAYTTKDIGVEFHVNMIMAKLKFLRNPVRFNGLYSPSMHINIVYVHPIMLHTKRYKYVRYGHLNGYSIKQRKQITQ